MFENCSNLVRSTKQDGNRIPRSYNKKSYLIPPEGNESFYRSGDIFLVKSSRIQFKRHLISMRLKIMIFRVENRLIIIYKKIE